MRINAYLALATGMSRRQADKIIQDGRVTIDQQLAVLGQQVDSKQVVRLNGHTISIPQDLRVVLLHKPVGYVVSRKGQGSDTIYRLLPQSLGHLKPVGRLDKDSSGLLLLTNNGQLAQQMTHPSTHKLKRYQITIDKALTVIDLQRLINGVQLDDGLSHLSIDRLTNSKKSMRVSMHEGRNRQIRRTFAALGYTIIKLHRTEFAGYKISKLTPGQWIEIS